jgi:hypothetical protein
MGAQWALASVVAGEVEGAKKKNLKTEGCICMAPMLSATTFNLMCRIRHSDGCFTTDENKTVDWVHKK